MSRARLSVPCSCLLVLIGCTTSTRPPASPTAAVAATEPDASPVPAPESPEQPGLARDKTLRPELAGGVSPGSPYLGVIERAGLVAIIEQGLGRVLARLKLSPVLEAGRFQGFRVSQIDASWEGAGILVGDVVLRLNGQPIERPEQAVVAFESLRTASEVSVELLRAGEKVSLRYRVE